MGKTCGVTGTLQHNELNGLCWDRWATLADNGRQATLNSTADQGPAIFGITSSIMQACTWD
jgi:hypothetical protein